MTDPLNNLKQLKIERDKEALTKTRHEELLGGFQRVDSTFVEGINALIDYLDGKTTKTEVVNQIQEFATTDDIKALAESLELLRGAVQDNQLDISPLKEAIEGLGTKLDGLPTEFPKLPEQKEEIRVTNLSDIDFTTLQKAITDAVDRIAKSIKAPVVNVPQTEVNVEAPDLSKLLKPLEVISSWTKTFSIDIPKTDLAKVEKKLDKSNELLTEISKIRGGGGGGGGHATPYVDSSGKHTYIEIQGNSVPVTVNPTVSFLIADEEEGATYAYTGFESSSGSWYIQRETLASGAYRYVAGTSDYSTAWTNRASQTYQYPSQTF